MSTLGGSVLGEDVLGELGDAETVRFIGGSWVTPTKRRVLTAAVMATSFSSFVAPPPVQARPVFSDFSEPKAKPYATADQPKDSFLSGPRAQPAPVFSSFSTPQRPQQPIAVEHSDWNFSFTPVSVPFSGFFDFAAARSYAVHPQQVNWATTLYVEPPVPGGGTSRRLNFRTGMEPVKKVWPKPRPLVDTRIPVPPVPPPTKKVGNVVPPPVVDVLPTGLEASERVVLDALDVADVQAILRKQEQDEQDAADIAEILRLLD